MENAKDLHVWEIAKRRASFKYQVGVYLVVITFLWAIWAFNGHSSYGGIFPWPVWPMMGWGIGLLFRFMNAYVFPKEGSVEREYEHMMRNRQHSN
ncbi:MAG: 2TM domain-containing protein [Chitinophagaceae bacterium]